MLLPFWEVQLSKDCPLPTPTAMFEITTEGPKGTADEAGSNPPELSPSPAAHSDKSLAASNLYLEIVAVLRPVRRSNQPFADTKRNDWDNRPRQRSIYR